MSATQIHDYDNIRKRRVPGHNTNIFLNPSKIFQNYWIFYLTSFGNAQKTLKISKMRRFSDKCLKHDHNSHELILRVKSNGKWISEWLLKKNCSWAWMNRRCDHIVVVYNFLIFISLRTIRSPCGPVPPHLEWNHSWYWKSCEFPLESSPWSY